MKTSHKAISALTLLSLVLSLPRVAPAEPEKPSYRRGPRAGVPPLRAKPPMGAAAAGMPAPAPAAPAPAAPPAAPAAASPTPPPLAPPVAGAAVGAAAGAVDLPTLPGEKEFTECKRVPAGRRVVVTLKPESELNDLIGWIKGISCRPFIIPANVRQGKVTIIVPEPITAGEAYRIFLSALDSMGLTIQPEGRVLKIIESNRARESPIPMIGSGEAAPNIEQYITRMIRLRNVTTEEMVQVLNRIKGRDGDITPYAPTSTLIITDLATNIRRMEEVVRALDVPMNSEKIWVIRLKNVLATEVAAMLEKIFGVTKPGQAAQRRAPVSMAAPSASNDVGSIVVDKGGAAPESELSISQIVPDERSNSLILIASEKTYLRVLALVKRLETQSGDGGGERVHVYGLENADSEDMAGVLQGMGVSVSGGRGGRAGGGGNARPAGQGGGGNAGLFQDDVKVTADKGTNSLVIVANPKDYLTLREVIRRLDVPRRQVYIEATVMEISLSKSRDLGVSYHGGLPVGDQFLLGGLRGNAGSTSLSSLSPLGLAAAQGLAGGFFGPLLGSSTSLGPQAATVPSYGIAILALQNNNDVNILQMPHIITTDNQKATIQVGQNLPFPSASFGGLGGGLGAGAGAAGAAGGLGFGLGTSVQRQDVALKLEITPHINASDYVRLEIDNEISDVADPNYNNLGPATNKRTIKTVTVVRDQQPVVLGGIMRDRNTETVTKIPLLGDIPILGYLFKIKRTETQKQMLLVVLTPYVINQPGDLSKVFERKMRERREFIEAYSAFANDRDFDRIVDYTRKRGALEEINRTATEAERDSADLRAAEQGLRREVEAGPVDLPVMPLRGGGGGGHAPAAPASAPSSGPAPQSLPTDSPIRPRAPGPAPVRQ